MHSSLRHWLRLEGLAVLLCATLAYRYFHLPWLWFFVLLLAPDLALVGYLAGDKAGAWIYNVAHTYALALPLVVAGIVLDQPIVSGIGLIWCAHIGMDRSIGYGLKSPEGFGFTHLGPVGRGKTAANPV